MLAEIHAKLASPEIKKEIPTGTSACLFFRINDTHGFKFFFGWHSKRAIEGYRAEQYRAFLLGFAPEPIMGDLIKIEYEGKTRFGFITRTIKQTITEQLGYKTCGGPGGTWDAVKDIRCCDDVEKLKREMRAHNFCVSDYHGNNMGYDENGKLLWIDFS